MEMMRERASVCFNTQPPEGGWSLVPPRIGEDGVSTHSRLKAAGATTAASDVDGTVSTHSRLKAAGDDIGQQPL